MYFSFPFPFSFPFVHSDSRRKKGRMEGRKKSKRSSRTTTHLAAHLLRQPHRASRRGSEERGAEHALADDTHTQGGREAASSSVSHGGDEGGRALATSSERRKRRQSVHSECIVITGGIILLLYTHIHIYIYIRSFSRRLNSIRAARTSGVERRKRPRLAAAKSEGGLFLERGLFELSRCGGFVCFALIHSLTQFKFHQLFEIQIRGGIFKQDPRRPGAKAAASGQRRRRREAGREARPRRLANEAAASQEAARDRRDLPENQAHLHPGKEGGLSFPALHTTAR